MQKPSRAEPGSGGFFFGGGQEPALALLEAPRPPPRAGGRAANTGGGSESVPRRAKGAHRRARSTPRPPGVPSRAAQAPPNPTHAPAPPGGRSHPAVAVQRVPGEGQATGASPPPRPAPPPARLALFSPELAPDSGTGDLGRNFWIFFFLNIFFPADHIPASPHIYPEHTRTHTQTHTRAHIHTHTHTHTPRARTARHATRRPLARPSPARRARSPAPPGPARSSPVQPGAAHGESARRDGGAVRGGEEGGASDVGPALCQPRGRGGGHPGEVLRELPLSQAVLQPVQAHGGTPRDGAQPPAAEARVPGHGCPQHGGGEFARPREGVSRAGAGGQGTCAQAQGGTRVLQDPLRGHPGRDRRGVCQRLPGRDAVCVGQAAWSHMQPCDGRLQGSGLGAAGPRRGHTPCHAACLWPVGHPLLPTLQHHEQQVTVSGCRGQWRSPTRCGRSPPEAAGRRQWSLDGHPAWVACGAGNPLLSFSTHR